MRDESRFADLLNKGRAGELSPSDTEELGRLLNAPILPTVKTLAGLLGHRPFEATDVAGRVRRIDWFARCGAPLSCVLPMEVEQVRSWPEAVRRCKDEASEHARLEAQNQLSMWLHTHDRKNFQSWNRRVVEYKAAVVTPVSQEALRPYLRAHDLDDAVIHAVQWDLLSALLENSYLDSGHSSTFFLELLAIYEVGHFPCGWRGRWPEGALLVF